MTNPIPISSCRLDRNRQNDENIQLQTHPSIEEGKRSSTEAGILAGMVLELHHPAAAASETMSGLAQASLSELIQYIIRAHHDYIREELPRLHMLTERVIAKRKWLNPELIDLGRKLRRLSGDLTFHMSHTESKVFPYIVALERAWKDGTPLHSSSATLAERLIEEVMVGHAPAGEMLRQIEAETDGFTLPDDACPDMVSLYTGLQELARRRSDHIQLEGYVLFPRALALEKEMLAA